MKKTLAILLALAMVFSTLTVAFAEGTIGTDAQACEKLGMLEGNTSAGVTADYLVTNPTRIQAALLFLRLKGLEDKALEFTGTDNFADANQVKWDGYKAVMAYLKANPQLGFQGIGNDKFDPNGLMNASQYYKVVLTALGYKQTTTDVIGDYLWENVLTFAADKGLSKVAVVTNFTVNDLAIATIEGLKATVNGSEKTLVASLIESGAIKEADAIAANVYTAPVLVNAKSVASVTNTKVKVTLETAQAMTAKDIAIVDNAGKAIEVKSVAQTADQLTAYVMTGEMVAGQIYTVTINGEAFTMVAKPATDTKLQVSTAMANNNVEVKVTFSANVDPTTALVAGNYAIDNDLKVTGVKAGDNAYEILLATDAQVAGKLYKVTVTNVVAENGNGLKTDANTAYFGGKAKDEVKPTAVATAATNTRFKVTFTDSSALDEVSVLNTANYVIDGLKVLAAAYDVDGNGDPVKNVVVLTTESQTAGKLYTVTVNNVADIFGNVIKADTKLYFGGVAKDEVKPTAVAQSLSNKSVKVTFSDSSDINAASATTVGNYVIDGLTVTAAELDGKVVTLTTSAQEAGKLYTMTVNNVADEYGNAIKADTKVYFGGKAVDTTAPTYSAVTVNNTTVNVVFSDAIDKNTVLPQNFYVKDLGYAVSAKLDTTLDSTGKTVVITTLAQTAGKVYTLEVRNVANTDSTLVKSDSKTTFAGMGSVTLAAPRLLAAVPVDSNTITLTFDQDLAVKPTSVVTKNNSTDATIDTLGSSVISFKGTSKSEVTVVLTTPVVEGTLYKVQAVGAIGANAIALDTNYDEVTFAGVTVAQTGAKILAVTPIDNNTVKVFFDKAVDFPTSAAATAATINLLAADKTTAINYADTTAVVAQAASLSDDGKEMTLTFHKAGTTLALTEGTIYTVEFDTLAAVQTVAGSKNLVPENTSDTFVKAQFGAVSTAVAGPELLAAVAQSKYVVDLTFNRPVALVENGTGAITSTLAIEGTNMPAVSMVVVDADDATKVRLYLNETGHTAFTEGSIYRVIYTPDMTSGNEAYFADVLDSALAAKLDTTGDYVGKATAQFGALGNVAEGPAVTAVTNINANTVKVSLDQAATGISVGNIVVKEGSTVVSSGLSVIAASDNKSFRIVRTDGIFKAGTTYTVSLTTGMKDVSGLRSADATVETTFGGNANVDLVLVSDSVATAGTLNVTLQTAAAANVDGKVLRFRVLTDDAIATTVASAEATTSTGAASWTITNGSTGEVYVVEATDGSVAITVITLH